MIRMAKRVLRNMRNVLAMNRRNLDYIYVLNRRHDYPLADDKLVTKEILTSFSVPVPETYASFGYFYDLRNLHEVLAPYEDFVIKPARGSGGGGILVVTGRDGDRWLGAGGKVYTLEDIRTHIGDILFGVYSMGLSDRAILEQRVVQNPQIEVLCQDGLADVRLILCRNQPVMAMIRLPTARSGGRANLHQGALGVGIDIDSGRTIHASQYGEPLTLHPDNGRNLIGLGIPGWDLVVDAARRASLCVPLNYLGVDVAISSEGPKILELNVRPGIEIQNVNNEGMRGRLQRQEAGS